MEYMKQATNAYRILMDNGYEYEQLIGVVPFMVVLLIDFWVESGVNEEDALKLARNLIDTAYKLYKTRKGLGICS